MVLSGLALFLLLAGAILASAYGLGVLAFALGAGFVVMSYARVTDTPRKRAVVVAYVIAGVSYIASGTTMPNVSTFPPATAYVFVVGLKFVPLLALVIGYWVVLGCYGDSGFSAMPGVRAVYWLLGVLFLLVEFISLGLTSGDGRVGVLECQGAGPSRWVHWSFWPSI